MTKYLLISAIGLAACSGVTYRAITYPSPCEGDCKVMGYEIWGDNEEQMVSKAEALCGQRAHISMSFPIKEYSVTRCESHPDPLTVVVTEE
jgi:hypothetical protein